VGANMLGLNVQFHFTHAVASEGMSLSCTMFSKLICIRVSISLSSSLMTVKTFRTSKGSLMQTFGLTKGTGKS
jgi:hypothetical protein